MAAGSTGGDGCKKASAAASSCLPSSASSTVTSARATSKREASVLMAARPERSVPAAEARTTVAHAGGLAPAASSNRVKVNYAGKRGDTLSSLARLFQTTVASIKSWNPRIPGERLTAGQRLTLYRLAN